MKLSNRLIYFMGGFLIGICILIFIWDKKNTKFPYMPDARVINDVNSKNVHYSNKLHTAFAKNIITASQVQDILKNGNVNFSKSNTKLDSCKIYVIEKILSTKNYSISLENCTNEVRVFDYSFE
ncbi:hypothetical protein N9C38_01420 [Flavobacteriaceae bacterium]|nr:hypothetical protein [Flavobacteriales bacterium]MBL6877560.1 hypothetical protein [Flavobacteriaceae bacterium]MDA9550516.1 hypothetical protein [Flavobacteriaceae bacterium]MDA9849362.1 hypothetical protein [Flavobacteriaceae bacterium]MDG1219011.1 hypothetical protein [Flavobacteriaceae bacterium]